MGNGASGTPQKGSGHKSISPSELACHASYGTRVPIVRDARVSGPTETKVKAEIDVLDRHELFLLADGEKKIEYETVTRKHTPTRAHSARLTL